MILETEQLLQLTGTIWEATLNLPIEPASAVPSDRGVRSIAAWIQITGAWNGAILLDCPADVARIAGSAMFAVSPAAVQVTDMQGAIAELVNMIGGNFKALLPETCYLSLPSVAEGGDYSSRMPGATPIGSVDFGCQGQNVSITVFEKVSQSSVAA